jgi:phage terminase large subunit GpA-like protein
MTAARLLPVVVQGKHAMRWITPQGHREEAGDAMVYAYAAACYLGVQSYREGTWARREQRIAPREADLFAGPAAAVTADQDDAVQRSAPQTEPTNSPARKPKPPRGRFGGRGNPWGTSR